MRILAFSNCALDPGLGSGRTRLAWTDGLRARGHEVEVVQSDALLAGAEGKPGRRLRMGWNGWRWLRTHDLSRYDLIEFYGAEFWPGTWGTSRRPLATRPLLVAHTDGLELLAAERELAASGAVGGEGAARGLSPRALVAKLLQRAETFAFSRSDGFVTGCELDRAYLRAHGMGNPDRMEVIPPCLGSAYLDVPFQPARENRVAFLGSWLERKGIAHLRAAMIPLLRARPDVTLDLFGIHAEETNPLEGFPSELHSRVVVHPRHAEVAAPGRICIAELIRRLSMAKVFFFPSEYEGFGLGLAEAMGCGCAVVTTPTGFGADLRDGDEAMLCPFGDVEAMRNAVARLLDDDPMRVRIAGNGWRRVQGLRWEVSVAKLETTYLRWLEGHRAINHPSAPAAVA